MTVTLFSWGYWGWGNATRQLVQAADAAEAAKGFEPPFFVDIRYRRGGRSLGFKGDTFQKMVGPTRYRHLKGLGNRGIVTGSSHVVLEYTPAVEYLLDIAIFCASNRQRVIFYCACPPPWEKEIRCHRYTVARLALRKAEHWGRRVSIVDWPGGNPRMVHLDVKSDLIKAVRDGRKSIPIRNADWPRFAGLPWGSTVHLRAKQDYLFVASGPVRFSDGWYLPTIEEIPPSEHSSKVGLGAKQFRKRYGIEA